MSQYVIKFQCREIISKIFVWNSLKYIGLKDFAVFHLIGVIDTSICGKFQKICPHYQKYREKRRQMRQNTRKNSIIRQNM